MWHRQLLRQARQARRRAKAPPRALLTPELAGMVALTLHPVARKLTVSIGREFGA